MGVDTTRPVRAACCKNSPTTGRAGQKLGLHISQLTQVSSEVVFVAGSKAYRAQCAASFSLAVKLLRLLLFASGFACLLGIVCFVLLFNLLESVARLAHERNKPFLICRREAFRFNTKSGGEQLLLFVELPLLLKRFL